MAVKNPDFERQHPRDAEGQFTEKAGASAPRWMTDLDAKIELHRKQREASYQPGYVPERRSAAQQFAAAASTPPDRDVIGSGNPDYGRGLAAEVAKQKKSSGLPRRGRGDAIAGIMHGMARDVGLRVDPVVATGLSIVFAQMANGEFPVEDLPRQVALFGSKTWGRGKRQDGALIGQLAKNLDRLLNNEERDFGQYSMQEMFGVGLAPFVQHPGVMAQPIGWL